MTVDTPQRRRRIQQLIRNAFPGCTAQFLPADSGALAFRVRGPTGRPRSGVLRLLGHQGRVRLNADWLQRQLGGRGKATVVRSRRRTTRST
jgi:hypothetical protein